MAVVVSTHSGHFIAPVEGGFSCEGRPSAFIATVIWSPEHIMTDAVGGTDAATALGSSAPSTIANSAARNASDRVSDQCSEDEECTALP
nr:hypothetical protein [Brevundimonas diminuta]